MFLIILGSIKSCLSLVLCAYALHLLHLVHQVVLVDFIFWWVVGAISWVRGPDETRHKYNVFPFEIHCMGMYWISWYYNFLFIGEQNLLTTQKGATNIHRKYTRDTPRNHEKTKKIKKFVKFERESYPIMKGIEVSTQKLLSYNLQNYTCFIFSNTSITPHDA